MTAALTPPRLTKSSVNPCLKKQSSVLSVPSVANKKQRNLRNQRLNLLCIFVAIKISVICEICG